MHGKQVLSMSQRKLKPQRVADFPEVYRVAVAYWSVLRDLGFSADDIFFGFDTVSGLRDMVHLQLQTQGRQFTIVAGQLSGHAKRKVLKTWQRIAEAVHASTQEERVANANACFGDAPPGYLEALSDGIRRRGIVIPTDAPRPDAALN